MKNKPLVIAHRGFSAHFPENTLLAFDEAIKVGATAMEFDVQLDADGEAVVFHDFELGRTTPEEEAGTRVRDLTTEEFLELDVGAYKGESDFYDTPPALLSEVLGRYSDKVFLNIELKIFDEDDAEEIQILATRVNELLSEIHWKHGVISSFCPQVLAEIKKLNHSLPIALLGPQILQQNLLADAIKLGAIAYNFDGRDGVTQADIAAIHAQGLKAYAYTINDVARAQHLAEIGIDGIFTDHPDVMLSAF